MNLFESLGLKADPFTTSPNVNLFFPATEHKQCLEGLELAIRMRRGLSVIRGGIGVGKTTISRKLIHNFESDADVFDFYLILDPKFESELILLQHIIELFSINDTGESVQKCRNIIENYLLRVGVDQGKTLVLVVDEGQNLPEEMLDVFRTLLNFETDDYKLLQLIMFGQPEMGKMINKYPNFEDRISFDFEIGPLNLADTKGFIEYRLAKVGAENQTWFSPKSIEKIYKNTHGFPRKITLVCHQVLMAMMGEEADVITEDLVMRVISGKANTTGLLQQKKKDYTQVAVNKLLNVLRKDTDGETAGDRKELAEIINDDDYIGGEEPPAVEKEISTPVAKEVSAPVSAASDSEEPSPAVEETAEDYFIGGARPSEAEMEILTPAANKPDPAKQSAADMDVLPSPGRYPPFIPASKLPFDNTVLGISIDQGLITMALVHEQSGQKKLLTVHTYTTGSHTISSTENPAEFAELCERALESFDRHVEPLEHIPKSIIRKITKRSIVALNINDSSTVLKQIQIPKDSQKNKNQIIDWTARKDLTFPSETAILNHVKSGSDGVTVGIGDKDALTRTSVTLRGLGWEVRRWHPIGQAIYNSFRWNYPDHRHHSTLILHMGEQQSLLLGCVRGELRFLERVPIGVQSLYEALVDQGIEDVSWSNRKEYTIPRSLLQPMGVESENGLYDTIFVPVFDTWLQEIDRTMTGVKYNFSLEEKIPLLLSGSAGFIQHLDSFIQGSLDLETTFLNPLRNVSVAPDESIREGLAENPAILTAAIGSAIKIGGTVNVLPTALQLNEIFRWANRVSIPAAAAILAGLLVITGTTRADYDEVIQKIAPLERENKTLAPIKEKHSSLKINRNMVLEQIDVLSYGTQLNNHILAITRFLSHKTPKQIQFEEISFQAGWEEESYKRMGRTMVKIIDENDTDKRILQIVGKVISNPALLERYFNNYIATLESSNLFYSVTVVSKGDSRSWKYLKEASKDNFIPFELRCNF